MFNKIKIYKGDTANLTFDVEDFDVSGYTYCFKVKQYVDDLDYSIYTSGSTTDDTTIIIPLTTLDTNIPVGKYLYEVSVQDGLNYQTIVRGELQIDYEL